MDISSVNKFKGKGEKSFLREEEDDGGFPVTASQPSRLERKGGSEAWKKRKGSMEKSSKRKLKVPEAYYCCAANIYHVSY